MSSIPSHRPSILFRPRRAWLLGRIGVTTILLSAVIKLRPLPATLSMFSVAMSDEGRALGPSDSGLATAVDAVLGMDLLMFRPVCWKRAILLHRLLALGGVATTIVFGVRTEKATLAGHAWLERGGVPIFEATPPDYNVTYRFPSTQVCEIDLRQMD